VECETVDQAKGLYEIVMVMVEGSSPHFSYHSSSHSLAIREEDEIML